jgi:DNA gyrase subunit B
MSRETSPAQAYDSSSIRVLKGLEAVRQRPGMYIGDVSDGSGLHHMVYEVVDNAVDEALAGHCDRITVTLNPDGSCTVTDNGRGIPVDMHAEEGMPAVEVIMTKLHAGGKFDQNSYKVSGGLHGVGVSVVNALSTHMAVEVWREGRRWRIDFARGLRERALEDVGKAPKGVSGTSVTFLPDPEIFAVHTFDFATLQRRLREIAFLNAGIEIVLNDASTEEPQSETFHYAGGLREFVRHLDRARSSITGDPVRICAEKDGIAVEVALQWNDGYSEQILCFTNNIPQRDGGTHLAGLRAAMTRVLTRHIEQAAGNRRKATLSGEDCREGLTCVLAVKVPDPAFSSQTKDKLVSGEVRPVVEALVAEHLQTWIEEHPAEIKAVTDKVLSAASAREAARKAREVSRKQAGQEIASLPGKLADCSARDPHDRELFIVEGDSAGGSAKQARDRRTQAILPLRGKILNVERVRLDRILASDQVGTLIQALGTGIGSDDFDPDKARYRKIVLMTDADVDGSHIRTLLLTFLFRQMRPLIERGWVYIAQPPLYKVKRGNSEVYLADEAALDRYLVEQAAANARFVSADGGELRGDALVAAAQEARRDARAIDGVAGWLGHHGLSEMLAVTGMPAATGAARDEAAQNAAQALTEAGAGDPLAGTWSYDAAAGAFVHAHEGLVDRYDLSTIPGDDANWRHLAERGAEIARVFAGGASIEDTRGSHRIAGPGGLWSWVCEAGRRGLEIQRYKGLGEMNPEQLWETTLDPDNRVLMQVSVDDAARCDDLVSVCMGDLVEPRRNLIAERGREIAELDI